MTDTFARMRQLIGTTAEWTANDLVIGNGEIAAERTPTGEIKLKVGDGTTRFSSLSYVTGGTAAGTFVPLADLTKAGGATHANKVPQLNAAGVLDPTLLNATATSAGAAASGKVVVLNTSGKIDSTLLTGAGALQTVVLSTGPADTGKIPVLDATGKLDNSVVHSVSVSTGTVDGGKLVALNTDGHVDKTMLPTSTPGTAGAVGFPVLLDATGRVPVAALPASASTGGGTNYLGAVNITTPPPTATAGQFVIVAVAGTVAAGWTGAAGSAAGAGDLLIYDGTKWDLIPGTHHPGAFLQTTGGTMTGQITLPGGGAGNQAATVTQVNARLALTGGTMTGQITLPGGGTGNQAATVAQVTAAVAAIDLSDYAKLASPAFTGNPTGTTPAKGDDSVSLATTAFVHAELADYAKLVSPAFSGNPTAPTPATADSDTSIATTAFVHAAIVAALATGGGGGFSAGDIKATASPATPTGWFECDGAIKDRAAEPALFAAIGTTWNTGGETSTQFRLPDFRGRVLAGVDATGVHLGGATATAGGFTGTNHAELGKYGGEQIHKLTPAEIPPPGGAASPVGNFATATPYGPSVWSIGGGGNFYSASFNYGGQAHNNVQPTAIVRYLIKA